MTDWFSREGARKGHDLAREQGEQADDKDVDSIVVADGGVRCEYCDQVFDLLAARLVETALSKNFVGCGIVVSSATYLFTPAGERVDRGVGHDSYGISNSL